ncbi:hypothetical protein QCD60_14510 [Pokkaliibacter sp. MBI-7]|uniref:hypothetical protein n=1 Tax=Pokkaliibacter sp. MBI-7 TaxID=3040600 RepID=UPI00244C1A72|nr:hypothetical protein [Pokkaliibacter sp. MBI-7]MDH2433782.1 hypothetical protein [Pokkaliibacter sp. MBI-7]
MNREVTYSMKALLMAFFGIALNGCAGSVKVTPLSITPVTLVRYADCGEYREDYLRVHFRFDSTVRPVDGSFASWAYLDTDKSQPTSSEDSGSRLLYEQQGQFVSRYNGKTFQPGEEADALVFQGLTAKVPDEHDTFDPEHPREGINLLSDNYDQVRIQIRLTNIAERADSNTMTFSRDEVITALTHQPKTEIRGPLSPHAECPDGKK